MLSVTLAPVLAVALLAIALYDARAALAEIYEAIGSIELEV